MCGIAGICFFKNQPEEQMHNKLQSMIDSIKHRGPDGEGLWFSRSGRIGMGHRRLAIIDLTDTGNQPMIMEQGSHAITFNGEIYNYLEIRKELIDQRISFKGSSDTEVLLAALTVWGIDRTLARIVGMFAFAFWREETGELILARDRVGKKPLYYYEQNSEFYFASEIKAIRETARSSLHISQEAIYHYLSLGYIPSPLTIYNEILEIPAGHYLKIDGEGGKRIYGYWQFSNKEKSRVKFDEAIEQADFYLREAVRMRLRSDVPVGILLSGGIDSGLITAMAAGLLDKPLHTFTVAFQDGAFDESKPARGVAHQYGTCHHEVCLNPDFNQLLPEFIQAYDQPFADPSALPSLLIAKTASEMVKVVLSGEGGDELFAGYRRTLAVKYALQVQKATPFVPESFWRLTANSLPRPRKQRSYYAYLNRALKGFGRDPFTRYLLWGSDCFSEAEKKAYLKKDLFESYSTTAWLNKRFPFGNGDDPLSHFMAMDFSTGLSDGLMVKLDIASMHYGLEARCPFLDHRLVEWGSTLGSNVLLSKHMNKPILRELSKRYLPVNSIHAPKRGFEIPLTAWMKGRFKPYMDDIGAANGGILNDFFEKKEIERLIKREVKMDDDQWAKRAWLILVLGLWDRFVNKNN